ncbi:Sec39 domain-containing protein [Podospora appendiculata]|uniref:Sec39 domain-containing protein n=1 Tax=Podospora appendiculata TaxID=314037 RepID=A0AAE0X4I0_9PEZI|nr:Sec39 domain-containing protein [Podospora appendiculata]
MSLILSPPKLVLLAVHLAVRGDIQTLTALAARHGAILRKDLLLRILLTYLPETLQSTEYVDLVRHLDDGELPESDTAHIDCSAVEGLAEEDARRKVKKLQLLPLAFPYAPEEAADDTTTLFLLHRAYRVDEEAGLLDELPGLLKPFLDHSPCIRTLMISAILPLLRRNCEYHPQEPIAYTLSGFEQLPDRVAVNLLLSQTGVRDEDLPLIGRDLRGLIGPWLFNERRWKNKRRGLTASNSKASLDGSDEMDEGVCPGWEQFLQWLTAQASKSWRVAVSAIEQWDGPGDIDLGGWGTLWFNDREQAHLEQTYARAALASAYLIPEASVAALEGAYSIVAKIAGLLDQEPLAPLHESATTLPSLARHVTGPIASSKNATYMRNGLLDASNVLTSPTQTPTALLRALILSAFLLTKAGSPCTLRRAGELALLQDEREQKAEATKFIHVLTSNGPKTDDRLWATARQSILWLRDWGANDASTSSDPAKGIFGQLKREYLEVEILKGLLANQRYAMAREIYEDNPNRPLDTKLLQDTIFATAMTAYDNASNPNRTRGGLKKCDDILKAFPKTIESSMVSTHRIEALLQATHALSEYRLVLKQGEPFTPVVLRVHTDPISIIGKILEQNPKSYTRIHDLLDLGARMVQAGLTAHDKPGRHGVSITPEEEAQQRAAAAKRITAMCIDAALTEDDFETAYSYVVHRLASPAPTLLPPQSSTIATTTTPDDDYSWKAALQAGKYRRTARTLRPTHLGTASGNPGIRHLEQRIECLSTALRIAPSTTLQEILNAFRRAEEELDAAIKAEAEQEDAWDAAGDTIIHGAMPGGFTTTPTAATAHHHHHHNNKTTEAGAAAPPPPARRHQTEDAPMSLFDLSRASVLSAQRNLTALSSLQRSAAPAPARASLDQSVTSNSDGEDSGQPKRAQRKRDQLREAALGSLVSGVGWLISAPAPPPERRE